MIISWIKAFKNSLKKIDIASEDEQFITEAELKMYWNAAEKLINEIIKVNYDELNLTFYAQSIYN